MLTNEQINKIVLVHDSLIQFGGAERVFGSLLELFPSAPVYTLVADTKIKEKLLGDRAINTSYLQNLYSLGVPFKYLLPLIPPACGSFVFPEGSIIISSSSLFLKGIIKPKGSCHIQYIHTPPRFLWTDKEYVAEEASLLLRPFLKLYLNRLRKWDKSISSWVDLYISNSKEVQKRVKEFYGRDSEVIYPFVDTKFWKPTRLKEDYFLMGGRLRKHKKYKEVLDSIKGINIKIKLIGAGNLSDISSEPSGNNVEFLGPVSDAELRDLYSAAKGFIYPPIEDAGIMPLEAAACGTATLAIRKAGSLETIVEGKTGEFFDDYNSVQIKERLLNWESSKYSSDFLVSHAEKFSKDIFEQRILNVIENLEVVKL